MSDKVLIVEDEFIVANDLRVILQKAGYIVIGIAASVEEAEEILQKHKPDLVLLDIRLDGKRSGIELAKKLKAENIAFVYISANSSQKVLEEAKTTEPYGFIVKPFREKDLLIALDIASYRQKNSLESRLRKEVFLQKRLLEIGNEVSDAKQKLFKVAQVIQSYIPFDLIVSGPGPLDSGEFSDSGYLRIGFEEYQFIGEKELMTITGLKRNTLATIVKSSIRDADPAVYYNGVTDNHAAITPLQKIWFDSFRIASYLVFPLVLTNGSTVHYSFYSRQRDIYTPSHMAMLNLFTTCLTKVTEKMNGGQMPTTSLMVNPGEKRSGDMGPDPAGSDPAGPDPEFKNIIGKHPLLLAALDLITQVAPYNTSVLILGESGTGKERIAHSIHALSPRKNGPFIKVNCAAIPATLIESELFGHEKGAFTGAIEKRKGKFELADRGTIFLDEIGELPLEMQVRLLRVLQEKEIDSIGGSSPKKVNVRIVAATNRNLEKEVSQGTFRLDLYYRLNVFPITLPPLRERKSDIEALAIFFANKFSREFNKAFTGIATSMMEEMIAYHWPGNIRELENILEQSVILNDGKSKLELKRSLTDATAELSGKINLETGEDVKHVLRETEREYIVSSLKKSKGLIRGANGAAKLLNIKPTTLESKMAKLGIRREDFQPGS